MLSVFLWERTVECMHEYKQAGWKLKICLIPVNVTIGFLRILMMTRIQISGEAYSQKSVHNL